MTNSLEANELGPILRDFFHLRMIQQCRVSHRTIASYRDTFRLLLTFAEAHLHKKATDLSLAELDAPLILAFLDYLETYRKNCIRTRNARLAAIRSFLSYAALKEPTSLPSLKQALAIPMKRFDRPTIGFLSREEIDSILEVPNPETWSGQRDRVLFTTLYASGARVSEVIAIKRRDVEVVQCTSLCLFGKGRKERVVPLLRDTIKLVRNWLTYIDSSPQTPLFPNRFGRPMSRSGVEKRLKGAVKKATETCPSLAGKTVSPHVLRHTTAVHLLQSGVDLSVIAILLGHESVATTHHYMDANIEMKERALAALQQTGDTCVRFKPQKDILSFLDSL